MRVLSGACWCPHPLHTRQHSTAQQGSKGMGDSCTGHPALLAGCSTR
jgi:hypothetical protein